MDVFDLDPVALETTASIIEGYCTKQREIMADYVSHISALSSDWDDDVTMGTLLSEITQMRSSVENLMNEICTTYPSFFRAKAEVIKSRPKRNN